MFHIPSNQVIFPHPLEADGNGILCFGGDLSTKRLILAYQHGIFPWYNSDEPIVWWFPNPRCVLFPKHLKIHKSMRSFFNQEKYRVTYDTCFQEVITTCQQIIRKSQEGTWINKDIIHAYGELFRLGIAHSVEVWEDEELVGGLYGVVIGKIFFGESMFAKKSNASKFGFISLVKKLIENDFTMIDCQQDTPHMRSLGAELISAKEFYQFCAENQKVIPQNPIMNF